MCLLVLALGLHPNFPVICAGNRDEFHNRPSQLLDKRPQPDGSTLYCGLDLQGGGTWLGAHSSGRFAMLTNIRDARLNKPDSAPSRGHLVSQYLLNGQWPGPDGLLSYSGFNLIAGHLGQQQFHYISNHQQHGESATALPASGLYALSNAQLNTPWPKAQRLRKAAEQAIEESIRHASDANGLTDLLIAALQSTEIESDENLPNTGVPIEWERMLSAIQIVSPHYGSRCSSVVLADHDGRVWMTETSYHPDGKPSGQQKVQFQTS